VVYNSDGQSGISNWIDVTTAQSSQSAPIAQAATALTSTSFTANWGDVDGATSFLLRVVDEATQEFILKDYALQGYSYKVTGLKADHSYTYAVVADFGSGKKSEISNWIDVTTLPAPPVAKAATAITSTSFTANWGEVVGANSYLLRVTDNATQEFILKDYSVKELTYKVTGLKANHSYSYAVIAGFDWGAETEISNWIDVKTAVATGIEDGRCSNLRIYPNPTSDHLTVDGLTAGSKVELFSTNGQVVKSMVARGENETISLSGIEKGLYLVVVKNENGQQEEKIMVK
ncbi:MAG TPA: T9SS type A sorting domain-containing protein, partial [Prolixibacteraceae bacterium]|nr:T9SS type A sorting domain-containing protein [Prolixibacteraceae bacterium]